MWDKESDKVLCTLCDSGGFVRIKPLDLKKLLPIVDPSEPRLNKKISEYAINCAIGRLFLNIC